MTDHVHEWMASSVGGVYLAICNALDDGNATCEATLTTNEIDRRLNATARIESLNTELLGALEGAINVIESILSPDEKWLGMDDAKEAIRRAKGA